MNYITEAFKSLEDVDDIIVTKTEESKKTLKENVETPKKVEVKESKSIKEDKDDLFEPDEKYNVYADENECIDMIHSIMAYSRDFKDGEDLVSEQEHRYTDYLKKFKDELGRDKVVELADIQVKRPHHIKKNVVTDSEGLSYNALIFDEDLNKSKINESRYFYFKDKKDVDKIKDAFKKQGLENAISFRPSTMDDSCHLEVKSTSDLADAVINELQKDVELVKESLRDVRKAFGKKKLTESESINLNDDEEIKKGKEILNSQEEEETEQIVDVDADTIDKLKDSYIGNVILQCPVCRTLIYKKPDLLKKDEEEDIYNKDEECPHCGSIDGFELVGQVASLDVEAEDNSIETTGTDMKEVEKDVEIEKETTEPSEEDKEREALKDKYDLPDIPSLEGEVEEEEEEEIKFESLDNKKFDKLVNRYAHNVYENFKSYQSTSGKVDNKKGILVVEGVISFKDGKSVKSRFTFNQVTESSKKGLVKFRGINEAFTKGKNAFILSTKVNNKEIVCESLKYNYKAKLNEEYVVVKGKVDNKNKKKK